MVAPNAKRVCSLVAVRQGKLVAVDDHDGVDEPAARFHGGHGHRRSGQGENRWPPAVAVVVAIVLYALLPSVLVIGPKYLVALLEVVLLGAVITTNPHRLTEQSRVSRVAVSQDSGVTWHDAVLDTPASPYAWTEWSLTLTFAAGEPEVWVRAFDDAGNAQPLDANEGWNPAGYEWGNAERVRLAVF